MADVGHELAAIRFVVVSKDLFYLKWNLCEIIGETLMKFKFLSEDEN